MVRARARPCGGRGRDRHDGRRGHRARRRRRLHRRRDHRRRAPGRPGAARPGSSTSARVRTGGTVYPGLIELHNHLSYNCLQLWQVPRPFTNRGQWSAGPDYRRLISGPMQVIGKTPDLVAAARALRRGQVPRRRRHDQPGHRALQRRRHPPLLQGRRAQRRGAGRPRPARRRPAASPTSPPPTSPAFAAELEHDHRLLLHLSEGTDDPARRHFLALQLPDGSWAITDHLIGIHCVGLHAEDIPIFAGARRRRWCGRRSRTCCSTAPPPTSPR